MHRIEKKTEKRMKENCGKIENILNLALDATREEREKSLNLDVGYDVADDSWEVIVKFFGTTEELRQKLSERFPEEQAQIGIYNLTNEYAILRIPQPFVELVAWKMENPWWKNSLKEDELFYIMGKEFIDNCETHENVS